MDRGRVKLVFYGWMMQQGYDTPVGRALVGMYQRVVVTYTPDPVVPRSVREAVAMIAAADIAQGSRMISGLTSESFGGYSYSMRGANEIGIPAVALQRLAPYKAGRVTTT
jgi:hypothetical protein